VADEMIKQTFGKNKDGKESLINCADTANLNKQKDIVITDYYTIGCLNKSNGEIIINTQKTKLSNESVIFYPPNQVLDIEKAKFEDGIFLFFKGDFLNQFFNDPIFIYKFDFFHTENKPSFVNLSHDNFSFVFELFKDIHSDIQQSRSDSEHYIRSLLYHLLIKLHRLYSDQHKTFGPCYKNTRFVQFKEMLGKDVKKKKTVQEYANALRMSRSYLNKLSKRYSGKTTKELISARLLLEAKKEILYSKKDISEIAYELNFSEPSNFFRFFKELTGLSPQQYRQEYSK
jgi:AraC-like DNA-binding protein